MGQPAIFSLKHACKVDTLIALFLLRKLAITWNTTQRICKVYNAHKLINVYFICKSDLSLAADKP